MPQEVTVKLFATLRRHLPPGSSRFACTLTLDEGATVRDVIDRLAIPEDVELITLVNGIAGPKDRRLSEGDVLAIFPMIAGG